jgi:hypothetical protein
MAFLEGAILPDGSRYKSQAWSASILYRKKDFDDRASFTTEAKCLN